MEYLYAHIQQVVAKRDFTVFRTDDHGELVGVANIPSGCTGTVESFGLNPKEGNTKSYTICFVEGNKSVSVPVLEDDMTFYLELLETEQQKGES